MKKMLIVIALTLGLSSVVFACGQNIGTTTFPSKIEPIGGYIGITNSPLKPSKSKTTCDCECQCHKTLNGWYVGQRVYDVVSGWGKISKISIENDYPIAVILESESAMGKAMGHAVKSYTVHGKSNRSDVAPSLYPYKVKIVKEE